LSNVIRFPENGDGVGSRDLEAMLLAQPPAHSHAVQFYEEEDYLFDTVAHFLATGLAVGDQLVVIATPDHRAGFLRRLETQDGNGAVASGRLLLLDARATLAKFMVRGMPDPDLFRDYIGRVMTGLKGDPERPARIRAYGEMVDLLWRDGNSRAAIRLEELWNDAGKDHSFSLLCAYVMGNFYKEGDAAQFFEVCRTHSHVLPTERFSRSDDPNARLREISVLQQRARALESEIAHRKELEAALRDALRERARAEESLRESLRREKAAREKAEANEAFKEMFLGILGHDLRNPLSSVLTTARTMTMRGDLSAETNTRLQRIIASGARMGRMIDQLLDLTRARLADGIPLARAEEDLGPLVAKIAEELRTAHPTREILLDVKGACRTHVDADRFEQVVSNLVGNAIAHGEPGGPVCVELVAREEVAVLSVHNCGTPIHAELLPELFNPFRRAHKPRGRADGLGLGLYIAERIVSGHGGKIVVSSSEAAGTRFEVVLPLHG
jgi:signal transduction histidine kinase